MSVSGPKHVPSAMRLAPRCSAKRLHQIILRALICAGSAKRRRANGVPLPGQSHLGASLDQNCDCGLGMLFASATPVQKEQHVHIAFASLDFGDIGLIYFEPCPKFCLRQAGSAPKRAQMLS